MKKKITVMGHGVVNAKPDVSILEVKCRVTNEQATTARETHAATMERVYSILRDANIRGEDLQSSSFSLGEYYKDHRYGDKRDGFFVEGTLTFRVRDLDNVAALFDRLVFAGATRINGPNLEVSNPETHRVDARKIAYADALERARTYCEAAGLRIVGPVEIEEEHDPYARSRSGKAQFLDEDGLVIGDKEITVNVQVMFEVAPIDQPLRRLKRKVAEGQLHNA